MCIIYRCFVLFVYKLRSNLVKKTFMPSPITISIRIQPYLVDFMEKIYGKQPIEFPRKDNFNRILSKFMEKEPPASTNYRRGDTNMEIQLTYFENVNVLYNFSLSSVQVAVFVSKIENTFKLTFRDEIDQYLLLGLNKIESIHLFMEKYGIREDAIDMLQKDYQRFRNFRRVINFRKQKKISSVKSRFCPACNAV